MKEVEKKVNTVSISRILIALLSGWILIYIITVGLFYGPAAPHAHLTMKNQSSFTAINPAIYCLEENGHHSTNIPEFTGVKNESRPPIFLIETTCKSINASKLTISARQACAIESAAKMNTNSDVYFLLLAETTLATDDDSVNSRVIKQVLSYPNVYIYHIRIENLIKGSLLEEWYKKGVIKTSPYAVSHISDMLRFFILWKNGGTYLDLDVVVKYPIEELAPNYAGEQEPSVLNGAVLNFARDGIGHKYVEQLLYDFRDNYRPDIWAYNGPHAISRLFFRVCGTKNISLMRRETCDDLEVHPRETFYPIYWVKWAMYFDIENSDEILKLLKPAKVIHLWNKVSKNKQVRVGSKAPYGLIADEFCPKVYRNCGDFF